MWQNKRSELKEILDLGIDHYSFSEYYDCLMLLGRINHFLGGFKATKKAFLKLKKSPKSILEVGCGGGQLCRYMTKWFPDAKITGIDINEVAIKIARDDNVSNNINFEIQNDKTLKFSNNQFDVVTTMLVCHHMQNSEFAIFLKECYRISKVAVIINDLQRHFLAFASFKAIAPILFPNRLICHDGPLSIRRSFHKSELKQALKLAGFHEDQYEISWNFAFRWTITIKKYED